MTLPTVLLVDDDPTVNLLNQMVLQRVGIRLDEALQICTNAQAALRLLTGPKPPEWPGAFPPGLVLLDINMPETNGFELLDALGKQAPETAAAMQVFLLTSSVDHGDQARARRHPLVAGYLEKPLTTTKVRTLLQELGVDVPPRPRR